MKPSTPIFLAVALALSVAPRPAPGQQAAFDARQAIDACRKLEDQQRRLLCYDRIPGASVTGSQDPHAVAEGTSPESGSRPETEFASDADSSLYATAAQAPDSPTQRSRMMRDWELDDATHGGLLRVRTYRSVYALPVRYTTRRNNFPSSPASNRSVSVSENLDSIEAKFQLSLKTKLLDDPIFDNGDVWFAYTQQSNWQAYNGVESSPFRENNFEPEIFSTWRTGLDLPGMRWQFVSLGFSHQSNGRSQPFSRSWNRLYADFGFERGDWQLFIRPWLRVEVDGDDDNPDIEDFLGRGDVRLKWRKNNHDVRLLARWAPSEKRGALQLDWHYPLFGDLKAYLQLFTGYGETLIDYNHRQTTLGLGVSLVQ
ncbi:MAG: phospholipase A [Xanthomonadaceae bacterium]|nr:phospholipase A [Xanthomonadaceae bacterium]